MIQIYVTDGAAEAKMEYSWDRATGNDRAAAFYALLRKLADGGYRGHHYEVTGDSYARSVGIPMQGVIR